MAKVIGNFTQAIGLGRFAIYVFDYGAPVGLRLALAHPALFLNGVIGHAIFVGFAIAWFAHRSAKVR